MVGGKGCQLNSQVMSVISVGNGEIRDGESRDVERLEMRVDQRWRD